MEIYHHTKYENLEKIIKQEGLSYRGSYYEEFSDTDYKWTKRVVSRIIKRICKNRKAEYDKDSSFKPIVISFGKDPISKYMWERYANNFYGIQFIIDYDIIRNYALEKLDYFSTCNYVRKRNRMKQFLEKFSYNIDCTNDIQQNLEAVSVLIKPVRFRKEQEIRYTHAYSKLFSISYENYLKKGDKAFEVCIPEENDKERYVCFPKDALIGIRIGYNSSHKLEEVKLLLSENGYDLSKIDINIYKP